MNECSKCPEAHKKICETTAKMCAAAELIANGKVARQEKIAAPESLQHLPQAAYGEKLWELMRDKEATDLERLEAIRRIDAMIPTLFRKKAILSMMLCDISQRDIGDLMRLSHTQVSRIARANIVSIK